MALNLGAFAGGLAQGGVNTYRTLQDIESQKQERELRAMQMEDIKREREGKEALRQAIGEIPQADTVPVQQFGTGTGGVDEDRPMVQQPMSQQDKMANFQQRAVALGADPTAVQHYAAGNYQLQNAGRSERYAQQQEHALGFQKNIMADLTASKGDVGAVLEKHFIPLYNENKLPGLNDGGTAKLVDNAMGGGKAVLITAKDGKQSTLPADLNTLQMLTGKAQEMMMASSSPENYWKHKENYLKEQSNEIAARGVGVHEKELDEKIKSGLFPAQTKQALGAAAASNAHAAVYNNMAKLAADNKAAGEVMKPFLAEFSALTPEEQQGSKGIAVLTAGAAAAAKKTGDITGVINALKKPDLDTKITVNPDGSVTKGGVLYVPDPSKPGMFKPAEGLGPSNLDKAIAARTGKQAPAPATVEPQKTALPQEETTKYIRTKTPRGSYTYTASPRGMTKAQWEALDATKQ